MDRLEDMNTDAKTTGDRDEFIPECIRCGDADDDWAYHPQRPGVVLCSDCYKELDAERQAVTDGGEPHVATTTVRLQTAEGRKTVDLIRPALATEAALVDHARKVAGVDGDDLVTGEVIA